MTETPTPDDQDVTSMSDEEVIAPTEGDASVQEIARSHPSAGSEDEPEGVEQENNAGDPERAADGGPGAGVDYAGSGF